jgi:alpha-N-arabinofuranosidase
MNARNTFDQPQAVKTADFTSGKATSEGFTVTLPAKSVVVLELQ